MSRLYLSELNCKSDITANRKRAIEWVFPSLYFALVNLNHSLLSDSFLLGVSLYRRFSLWLLYGSYKKATETVL